LITYVPDSVLVSRAPCGSGMRALAEKSTPLMFRLLALTKRYWMNWMRGFGIGELRIGTSGVTTKPAGIGWPA
jgi:hypothetical protein